MKPALAFVAPGPSAAALPTPAPAELRPSYAELSSPHSHRGFAIGVLAAHLVVGWALMQMSGVRRAMAEVAPIVVRIITPGEPPKPVPPPQLPKLARPTPLLIEAPLIAIAAAPAPAPMVAVIPPPPPAPAPTTVQTAPAPPAPVLPPAPPALKQIPAGAVRYLAEPRMTVPVLSRRLGEAGIVQVRVVVDVRGLPREITLKKSSGFARLDQQALQDMRSARFVPQTENGQPIEWEVIAPMSYEIDR